MIYSKEIQAEAFERKAELGGGFRGRAVIKGADYKRTVQTDVLPTQQDAFIALYALISPEWDGRVCSVGHYKGNRFRKNYFVR